ncbi:hypothetical protein SAMN05216360_101484 [Methylobacterium phyllostachyos]|uniref:Secreted protein n=1 Tax=Methylobacterium phyllostachyos TaxID=582672 RepID=A0A1G9S4I9_9HYPH|nr:hypothetical protein SAMN05216360_101484 [Methylobacterium phyllostachyos]
MIGTPCSFHRVRRTLWLSLAASALAVPVPTIAAPACSPGYRTVGAAGRSIHARADMDWRRETYGPTAPQGECPPGLKQVAGTCLQACPGGYEDRGATCLYRNQSN